MGLEGFKPAIVPMGKPESSQPKPVEEEFNKAISSLPEDSPLNKVVQVMQPNQIEEFDRLLNINGMNLGILKGIEDEQSVAANLQAWLTAKEDRKKELGKSLLDLLAA